jgi:hypothetical protein
MIEPHLRSRLPRTALLGAVVISICAAGCSSRFALSVRVIDAVSDRPVADATIVQDHRSELSAWAYTTLLFGSPDVPPDPGVRSDADGNATLTIDPRGHIVEFGAQVRAQGYEGHRVVFPAETIRAARKPKRAPSVSSPAPDFTIQLTPAAANVP